MTADQFRAVVLALEGVEEGAHVGHPDFRTNGRIFASLTAREDRATVKLSPEEQAAVIESAPTVFSPAAGAWGRQGWTVITLEHARVADIRGPLTLAWEAANAAKPGRAKRKR